MTNSDKVSSAIAPQSAASTAESFASAQPSPHFAGPLYMQVASILRLKICSGEWTGRAPLPNEVVLARDIGVSIGTMRKALELLENEHLVERRQGRGTFVVESSVETELERFSNIIADGRKVRASSVVWSIAAGLASEDEARFLQVRFEAPVYRLQSDWGANQVMCVEHVTVSRDRFPGLPDHVAQGGQFLFPIYRRHYREPIAKVRESVSPIQASAALASQLKIVPGQAVMQISRLAYGLTGGVLEWSRRTMHLGRAEYQVTMT